VFQVNAVQPFGHIVDGTFGFGTTRTSPLSLSRQAVIIPAVCAPATPPPGTTAAITVTAADLDGQYCNRSTLLGLLIQESSRCGVAVGAASHERLVDALHACLQLVAQTADPRVAEDWLRLPVAREQRSGARMASIGCPLCDSCLRRAGPPGTVDALNAPVLPGHATAP
jgi:hypothetical protein